MPNAAAGMPALMAGYLLRTTVVLTLALVAAAAAKRRPAALRHFILSSALIGLLLLPFLGFAPVGWRSPLLPGWMAAPGLHVKDMPAAKESADVVRSAVPVKLSAEPAGNGSSGHGPWVRVPLALVVNDPAAPLPRERSTIEPVVLRAASQDPVKDGRRGASDLLLAGLWAAGLAALLLRLGFGLTGAVRLTAEGTPIDNPAWRVLLERFLALISLRRSVRLRSHPQVLVPLTWGWRKPVVLLPEGAETWTDDERSSALYHELSHIKRADFLVMLLVRTSLALFWWNPLCWVVYRELLKEQEIACDELVLRAGIRPSTYAASLLAFRRSAGFRWNPSAALLGLLGRSSFQERLAAILKQKMILMEVKMKTKVMLALALAGAVALIGTARPAVGREIPVPSTVLAETAVPAPAPFDVAFGQTAAAATQVEKATQQKEQEKAKAAEKAKEAEKAAKDKAAVQKTIVIKPVAVEGKPIEVVITEGDQVKKLVVEKPLTITKSKDGETIVLTIDGKDIEVLKGEPLRLEIKGGALEVMKEGQLLKVGEGGVYRIIKEGGEEGSVIVVSPRKLGKELRLKEAGKEGLGGVEVVVEPGKGTAWKIKESGKGEAVWVAKELAGEPVMGTWVGGGGKAFTLLAAKGEEMLERIHALQEQVQAIKAKKMDITALEESLKKLEAELQAKEDKLKSFEYELERSPEKVATVKMLRSDEAKGGEIVWVTEKEKAAVANKTYVKVMSQDENVVTIILGEKGLSREAYERVVAKLKDELPEGATIAESSFDEDASSMTFKIGAPKGKALDKTVIKKIIETLRAEIDKK